MIDFILLLIIFNYVMINTTSNFRFYYRIVSREKIFIYCIIISKLSGELYQCKLYYGLIEDNIK